MKKVCLLLLAALLLCGLFACNPGSEQPAETMPSSASEEIATDAPQHDLPALTFPEQAMTLWESTRENSGHRVQFSSDGTAMLNANVQMQLTENDGTFTVRVLLGDEPYGNMKPAFRAGEVRLFTDGETLEIDVADDPYGILAYEITDQTFRKIGTVPEEPWVWFNDTALLSESMQPGTHWSKNARMEEQDCWFTVSDDLKIRGSVNAPMTEENGRDVIFIVMTDSTRYAFLSNVRTGSTGERELLFYGISRAAIDGGYGRDGIAVLRLEAIYDPMGIAKKGYLTLCREPERDSDALFSFQLGANIDTMTRLLLNDGWTDETAHIAELDPSLEGHALRFLKDGKTLFGLWHEGDSMFGEEPILEAFVLYDTDGSVLRWSGRKPIQRAAAEAISKAEPYLFSTYYFSWCERLDRDGFLIEFYFLDEGSVAIYRDPHDYQSGDEPTFRIIRVIP